jgi:hypothetical protein
MLGARRDLSSRAVPGRRALDWRLKALIALLAVLLAVVAAWFTLRDPRPDRRATAAPGARGPALIAPTSTASLEDGDFREFSQNEARRGSLTVTHERSYDGSFAARAVFDGSTVGGFARAIQNVLWREGQDVWYGSAFYLSPGFKQAMEGEVPLLRWDNYPSRAHDGDVGGVVLWGSDKRARLVLSRYGRHEHVLVGPFELPEGRWFSLLIHQRLAARPGRALSEVYLNGLRTGSSTAANMRGRPVERLRFGLVATDPEGQQGRLTLWFDRSLVTSRRRSPSDTGVAERAWSVAPQIEGQPR